MQRRNHATRSSHRQSRVDPRLRKAYEALDALRHELHQEWEECIEQMRLGRVGTSHDEDSVETSQMSLGRRAEQLAGEIRDLEAAIDQLSAGAYGICTDCDRPIPAARLAARPDAVRCRQCQEIFEGETSFRSAERRAPVDFMNEPVRRAAMSLPRASRPNRAGAAKELSKMAGSKKSPRRTGGRKKARGEAAAKTPRRKAAAPRTKQR